MKMKNYYLIEETTWNVSPKEEEAAGVRVFVAKMKQEKADEEYREDGYYQHGEHVEELQGSEDSYVASGVSYSKIVIDKAEYKEYKQIIKWYDELLNIF